MRDYEGRNSIISPLHSIGFSVFRDASSKQVIGLPAPSKSDSKVSFPDNNGVLVSVESTSVGLTLKVSDKDSINGLCCFDDKDSF